MLNRKFQGSHLPCRPCTSRAWAPCRWGPTNCGRFTFTFMKVYKIPVSIILLWRWDLATLSSPLAMPRLETRFLRFRWGRYQIPPPIIIKLSFLTDLLCWRDIGPNELQELPDGHRPWGRWGAWGVFEMKTMATIMMEYLEITIEMERILLMLMITIRMHQEYSPNIYFPGFLHRDQQRWICHRDRNCLCTQWDFAPRLKIMSFASKI